MFFSKLFCNALTSTHFPLIAAQYLQDVLRSVLISGHELSYRQDADETTGLARRTITGAWLKVLASRTIEILISLDQEYSQFTNWSSR